MSQASSNKPKPNKTRSASSSAANTTDTSSSQDDKPAPCGSCRDTVSDDEHSGVECEVCLTWFHPQCAGLTVNVVRCLSKPGIHWFCAKCDQLQIKVGYQVIRVERQLAELKDLMQSTLDTKLNAIKQSYAEVVKKVEESSSMIAEQNSVSIESYKSIKQQTDLIAEHTRQQRDREEREFRERNLIIFGIPESSEDTVIAGVKTLMDECHVSQSVNAKNLYRLGKIDQSKTTARPVRLCTESSDKKWDILKKINQLRKGGVFARLDLNEQDRKEDFRLRQELKGRADAEPGKKFKIFRKRVVEIKQS